MEATKRAGRRAAPRAPIVALAAVVVAFLALGTIIAVKTPAWEAADEPSHVRNVETLASGHWYRMQPGAQNEAHQPPLYYLVLAGWQRVAGLEVRQPDPGPATFPPHNGGFREHRPADLHWLLWLRAPNLLLGIATIVLTAAAAREVSRQSWTPVVAAGIVAAVPRFVFLSAFVTNDNLANALGALLAFVALRYVNGPSRARLAVVGAVVGLLVLTKLSALPLAAVVPVLVLGRRRGRERTTQLLVAGAAAAGVCGWFLVQNAVRYGDPLARTASMRYLAPTGGLGTLAGGYHVRDPLRLVALDVPRRIVRGFWYMSGWNQYGWPVGASLAFWLALAAALLGLARRPLGLPGAVLATLVVTGFASVWIVAFQTASYEARLALPGLPALACLAALGVERWPVPLRFLLPLMGLVGTIVAVQQHVLAIRWS